VSRDPCALVKQQSATPIFTTMVGTVPEDIESNDDQRQDLRDIPSIEPAPLHDRDLPVHKAAYKGDHAQVKSLLAAYSNIHRFNSRSAAIMQRLFAYCCLPEQMLLCWTSLNHV
jgi:hypothetical protein